MQGSFAIEANHVDIAGRKISPVRLHVREGRIERYEAIEEDERLPYLLPGFIDSHVHVESSMLVPSEFARLAVVHGTIATISDPHEIANVCGVAGVQFMIDNGKQVPFKFHFGAPSCVPATAFETAGAAVDAEQVRELLASPDIFYLSEMMNFPGVLNGDPEVMQKLEHARRAGKPIDGHAPGLRGEEAARYARAGDGALVISTDHECFTEAEARDKLAAGMHILIREGSAARNFDALIGLLDEFPERVMFCSDDKHPDSLAAGHINQLCERAVARGCDLFNVLRAACYNPVQHYRMQVGQLKPGDPADFILVKDLRRFRVLETFIDGKKVAENGRTLIDPVAVTPINNFSCEPIEEADLRMDARASGHPVIEALDGQLITNRLEKTGSDNLKLAVLNRYEKGHKPAVAFIKGFGFTRGAIASSVAHDSHNVIAVGADDESLARAINLVIAKEGGVSCVDSDREFVLALPVAGLMSAEDGYAVAEQYTAIDRAAKALGSTLGAPFMTLSFMALLVIPHLKLSDKGLFDGDSFRFL